jgi:hypothetical protein
MGALQIFERLGIDTLLAMMQDDPPDFEGNAPVSAGRPLLHDFKDVLAGRGKSVSRMCAVARAG